MTARANRFGLIADIGGTHVRFALTDPRGTKPVVRRMRVVSTKDHSDIAAAARAYLKDAGGNAPPEALAFGVAGPVSDNSVHLTNAGWTIAGKTLVKALGARAAWIVNDFEALAAAVPHLGGKQLVAIGKGTFRAKGEGTIGIVGPGTGLGVGGVVSAEGRNIALVTEGGHASFAPEDETEIRVLEILMRKFGHVSAERILSGPGLLNLYGALAEIEGKRAVDATPEMITQGARDKPRSFEAKVFARFCAILGSVAGNLALTLGARKGVLIGGGILPDAAKFLAASDFRKRFEAKGRFAAYLKPIPTALIVEPQAGLIGAAAILQERLRRR